MSIETTWGNYFKSEVKTSGLKLVANDKVSLSQGSDTFLQAYVRGSTGCKVVFKADDISSPVFTAACSCPAASKAQFCKHVWAMLLCVDEKHPDFLVAKRTIDKPEPSAEPDSPAAKAATYPAARAATYKEEAKTRASLYRKVQYQKAKLRAKERKGGRSRQTAPSAAVMTSFPESIATALQFFATNGFPMADGPDEELLNEAKRKLSRVFHPDKGGTHDEIIELNEQCDVIERYLEESAH